MSSGVLGGVGDEEPIPHLPHRGADRRGSSPPRIALWGVLARGWPAIWGLVSMSAGLVLEAIGAFGYDGDDSRIGALTTLHNSAYLLQIPGLPLLVAAILLGIASLFQRTAEPVPAL